MLLPQRMHIYSVYSQIQELHTLGELLQRNAEPVSDGTCQPHVPFPFICLVFDQDTESWVLVSIL